MMATWPGCLSGHESRCTESGHVLGTESTEPTEHLGYVMHHKE